MRQVAAALIHIAVSVALVSLMTGVLLLGATIVVDLVSDADLLKSIQQSARSYKFELSPGGAPIPREELLELAQPLGRRAYLEQSSDTSHLVVVGPEDLAAVKARLRESGYEPQKISLGYDFHTVVDEVTSGRLLALLLLVQFISLSFVGWWRARGSSVQLNWFAGDVKGAVKVGLALGLAAAIAAGLLTQLFQSLGASAKEQPWVQPAVDSDPITATLFVLLIVICGPFAEEIFFRGYVFQLLGMRAPMSMAYLLSAAMFTAAHLNPTAAVIYLILGLAFAFALQRTGALASSVIAHSVNNLLAVTLIVVYGN